MALIWLPYGVVLILTLAIGNVWINIRQPAPYMDELFHVPQAQRFCSSFITSTLPRYDSAISTPPGLYLPIALFAFATHSSSVCTTLALRISSAVATILSFFTLSSILHALRLCNRPAINEMHANTISAQPEQFDYATALVVILTPVSFFYTGLYYTDPPAMLYILLTWFFSLKGRHVLSAVLGVVATITRQTNMFWHFFIACDSLLHSFLVESKERPTLQAVISAIMGPSLPHVFAGLLYLSFLYVNNGAAIGDKHHHVATVHHVMLPYFSLFHAAAHSFLQLACPAIMFQTVKALFTLSIIRPIFIGTAATMIGLIAFTADYAHPFTLADNRHFTFYLYRRWLLRSSIHRFALTPLYIWTPISVFVEHAITHLPPKHELYHQIADLLMLLVICTVMLHPLLELRYFTIPSLILSTRRVTRIRNPPSLAVLHVAIVSFIIANMIFVYIFAERPFPRTSDTHMPNDVSPGRFMF